VPSLLSLHPPSILASPTSHFVQFPEIRFPRNFPTYCFHLRMPLTNRASACKTRWPVPMEVKPSAIEGRGLFTTVPLRPRQKIGEYEGERITQREGRRRAKTQKWIAIVEVNNGKSIDGAEETTGFRFINHSCSPNTFMRIIGERAEFYALHPIKAGTELTLDYGDSHHNGELPCTCGSLQCRKFL
jgi:uncharacterized protein